MSAKPNLTSLKLSFNGEVRRLSVAVDGLSYQDLISKTLSAFPELTLFQFSWMDDENDVIVINSNEELLEALRVMSFSTRCLRFEVLVSNIVDAQNDLRALSMKDLELLCLQLGYRKNDVTLLKRQDRVEIVEIAAIKARQTGVAKHLWRYARGGGRINGHNQFSGIPAVCANSKPSYTVKQQQYKEDLLDMCTHESVRVTTIPAASTTERSHHLDEQGSFDKNSSHLDRDTFLDEKEEVGEPPAALMCRLVRDVTMPDGSEVAPHSTFLKTWRVRNDGQRAWPEGCHLVSTGGDRLCGSKQDASFVVREPVPAVPAGEEVELTLQLRAPSSTGRHVGYFRLEDPEGGHFGQRLWTDLRVTESDMSVSMTMSCWEIVDHSNDEDGCCHDSENNDNKQVGEEKVKEKEEERIAEPEREQQLGIPLVRPHAGVASRVASQQLVRDQQAVEAALWSQELAVLCAMGFSDLDQLLPVLRTHIRTPSGCCQEQQEQPWEDVRADSEAGLQAVVQALLAGQE